MGEVIAGQPLKSGRSNTEGIGLQPCSVSGREIHLLPGGAAVSLGQRVESGEFLCGDYEQVPSCLPGL